MGTRRMAIVLRLLGIGWFVALSISGLGYAGYWLDNLLDLGPVLTLLGLGAGITVALIGMFRMLTVLFNNSTTSGPPSHQGKG
ncbi:AtpZ/AtpI family protein [Dehalococcoidia bacterium]|nr:AtpZ/AtpI family protein [Dehalococcoidia bacterium]